MFASIVTHNTLIQRGVESLRDCVRRYVASAPRLQHQMLTDRCAHFASLFRIRLYPMPGQGVPICLAIGDVQSLATPLPIHPVHFLAACCRAACDNFSDIGHGEHTYSASEIHPCTQVSCTNFAHRGEPSPYHELLTMLT